MAARDERRIGVFDLMAVIAGLAAGFGFSRYYIDNYNYDSDYVRTACYFSIMFVLPMEPVLLILRLRRPWHSLRRVTREPGFVAALAALLTWCLFLLIHLLAWSLPMPPNPDRRGYGFGWLLTIGFVGEWSEMGRVIAAVWLIQYLSGRWRPRPTWIDRAGRILGAYWIVLVFVMNWYMYHS